MGVDSCAIYGLESQGRALCSHIGEEEAIRFYVGTLSPRSEGQIHQIDFDEETNHISRKVYKPKVGEIWQVQCPPSSQDNNSLLALTYNNITETNAEFQAGIFRMPKNRDQNDQDMKCLCKFERVPDDLHGQECRSVDWHPTKSSQIAVAYSAGFAVWDLQEGSPSIHSSYNCSNLAASSNDSGTLSHQNVYLGKWNTHLDGNQFSLLCGPSVSAVDVRSMQQVWNFKSAHKFQVRDIDFNPNKQYYFATCGDDCAARFWDIRKPNECLKEVQEHTHWVWRIRYNSFHDQLVLTSGSDSRVVLHALPSISSEPTGHMVYSEGDGEDERAVQTPREQLEEGVLSKYEEHEDAVYVTEWSNYDPWIFASLSYDGRLVINRVPQSQKYKILL